MSYVLDEDQKKQVIIVPDPNPKNPYISIIKRGLEEQGYVVGGLRKRDEDPVLWSRSPVILNWFEEVVGTPRYALHLYRKKMQACKQIAKSGCALIYVIHNRAPHDVIGKFDYRLTMRLRRHLCKISRHIVILSDQTRDVLKNQLGRCFYGQIEKKIVKIPHPSYATAYSEDAHDYRAEYGISHGAFLFVFTGAIRAYKNIELIIDVARFFKKRNYNAVFLVMGRCNDGNYLKKLQNQVNDLDNLILVPEYVPNEHMVSLIRSANAMLLPYDMKSSLNSGTVLLAFTFGRTVVCPCIGTIEEYPENLTYSYSYRSDQDEKTGLKHAAERAYLDWKINPRAFNQKGIELANLVETDSSASSVALSYVNTFRG